MDEKTNFCTFDENVDPEKHLKFLADIDNILKFSGFIAQDSF